MKHVCWGGLDGVYKWTPRTAKPKSCPKCKARLDNKTIRPKTKAEIINQ